MTSNLGSDIILEGIENGDISEGAKAMIDSLLKRSFRPEFLNRLDEIIYFKPLTKDDVRAIVDLAILSLSERLAEKRLKVTVNESAREYIIDSAYDPIYGARPLKRFLASQLETLIAKKIIAEDALPDSDIVVEFKDGMLFAQIKTE